VRLECALHVLVSAFAEVKRVQKTFYLTNGRDEYKQNIRIPVRPHRRPGFEMTNVEVE
jgi:hypothetical protein